MRSSNYLRQSKRRQSKLIEDISTVFTSHDVVVGKDALASLMDVTVTTVDRWIRYEMPVEQRGDHLHDWIFNLNNVKTWKQNN